jgi:hypothetical protein
MRTLSGINVPSVGVSERSPPQLLPPALHIPGGRRYFQGVQRGIKIIPSSKKALPLQGVETLVAENQVMRAPATGLSVGKY